MKYLIASDVHGSSYYTKKLVDKIKELNIDKTFLLGDILFHGPRNPFPDEYDTQKVYTLLNELKSNLVLIKGNCDSEVDQMVLEISFVETALLSVNNKNIYMHHGHKNNINLQKGDIIISGHTHIPACVNESGVWYLNCGSISLPKGNSVNSFIVIDGNMLTCYDFDMNIIFDFSLEK